MPLTIGDTAPDFEAETSEGPIHFYDWLGDSWGVLFSHPKDFTPICTTELGYMAKIKPEFDLRNVKIIGLSVDSTGDHERWAADIAETQGTAPNYPLIADNDFKVAKLYGMLPADVYGDAKSRTPADNATVRNVFVIGPDKKIKLVLVYPMTTGRNFDEVLRVIDSLQLTAKHRWPRRSTGSRARTSSSPARSPTTRPRRSSASGNHPSPTSASSPSLSSAARLRFGLPKAAARTPWRRLSHHCVSKDPSWGVR